jgi:uncharacterized tellurite resistance protein B-like protein
MIAEKGAQVFGSFLKSLLDPNPKQLDTLEEQLALAAMLVRLARADEVYQQAEKDRIISVLARMYDLAPNEAQDLCHRGEALEAEAPDTVKFTSALKEAVAYEDRIKIITALWEVALADNERNADEDALVRLVSSLLGVSDVDSATARLAIERNT